ncbi:MAG: zf-HC2 domain-containing protein [Rhizobacter sp.]
MTNRAESDAQHRSAWEAIPWLVNGSAGDAQRRSVEAHVRDCDDCRAELARQQQLQAAMAQPPRVLPDVDASLQRLMDRIDEAEQEAAWDTPPPAPRRRAAAGALVYGLIAAVVIEAVGISVLAVDRRGSDAYRTLTAAPQAAAAHATIRVVPAATMTLGELQQTLQGLRLQIVSGPNEAGAYALAPLAQPPSLESQLSQLRAMSGVRFAEPIATPEVAR